MPRGTGSRQGCALRFVSIRLGDDLWCHRGRASINRVGALCNLLMQSFFWPGQGVGLRVAGEAGRAVARHGCDNTGPSNVTNGVATLTLTGSSCPSRGRKGVGRMQPPGTSRGCLLLRQTCGIGRACREMRAVAVQRSDRVKAHWLGGQQAQLNAAAHWWPFSVLDRASTPTV
ncbi:unnamed protein product [Ectocarpus fasciculatus]